MSHSPGSFDNTSEGSKQVDAQHDLNDTVLLTCEEFSVTISKKFLIEKSRVFASKLDPRWSSRQASDPDVLNSDSSKVKKELKEENNDFAVLQNCSQQEMNSIKIENDDLKQVPILVVPVTGFKGLAVKLFFEYLQDEEISRTKYFEWAEIFLEMLLIADYYGIQTNLHDLFEEQLQKKDMFYFDNNEVFDVLSRCKRLKQIPLYKSGCEKIEKDIKSSITSAEELRQIIVDNKNNLEVIIKLLEDIEFNENDDDNQC